MQNKQCYICKQNLPVSNFRILQGKNFGKLFSYCRSCELLHNRTIYHNKKQYYIKKSINRSKILVKNKQQLILKYLKNHHCVDCNISDIRVLEFDHVLNKTLEISLMIHDRRYNLKQLEKEIQKCEVRCCNCHRRKTHKDQNTYKYRLSIQSGQKESNL